MSITAAVQLRSHVPFYIPYYMIETTTHASVIFINKLNTITSFVHRHSAAVTDKLNTPFL